MFVVDLLLLALSAMVFPDPGINTFAKTGDEVGRLHPV
jgi:hypothetical protein